MVMGFSLFRPGRGGSRPGEQEKYSQSDCVIPARAAIE
jgi:hypothetical protein